MFRHGICQNLLGNGTLASKPLSGPLGGVGGVREVPRPSVWPEAAAAASFSC